MHGTRGVVMPVLGGEDIWLPLPDGVTDSPQAEMYFCQASFRIVEEWHRRRGAKASDNSTIAWFEPVAYQLLGHYFDNDLSSAVYDRLRDHNRFARGNETFENPFKRGLVALFAHDKEAFKDAKTYEAPLDSERERIAMRLWYGFRHYVPYEFLRCFLRESGRQALNSKVRAGTIEPGFDVWIISHRALDINPDFRGAYPDRIENALAGFRPMMPAIVEDSHRARKALAARVATM